MEVDSPTKTLKRDREDVVDTTIPDPTNEGVHPRPAKMRKYCGSLTKNYPTSQPQKSIEMTKEDLQRDALDTPFMKMLMKCQDAKIPFSPEWDMYIGDKHQFFVFANKLAGTMIKLKGDIPSTLINQNTDMRIIQDIAQLGTSLPFHCVSFFVDKSHQRLIHSEDWTLQWFNSDITKAERLKLDVPSEGKVGYHPYWMFVDKYTWKFLTTGDFDALYVVGRGSHSFDESPSGFLSTIAFFRFADIYPVNHNLHSEVMSRRWEIIRETSKMLEHTKLEDIQLNQKIVPLENPLLIADAEMQEGENNNNSKKNELN